MKKAPPYIQLERVLDGLAEELTLATDEEILAAAASLEMKPMMKGSAAFFGIKPLYAPYRKTLFEEPELLEDTLIDVLVAQRRARKGDTPE